MSLVKNQDIQLNIEGYTAEGNGVGHYEGQAVFVSGAAKGDTIIAHIIKAKKTYAIGIIKQIVKKSQDRIDADCPHFRSCGGCAYRHISYEAEKQLKKKNKNLIIAVGGCMTQQPNKAQELKDKFPFLDIIFGTHNLENFKELLLKKLSQKKAVIDV